MGHDALGIAGRAIAAFLSRPTLYWFCVPFITISYRSTSALRFSGSWLKAIWSHLTQLRSLFVRAMKRSTHFLEQSGVRHE
jgi:hypothetical protein